MADGGREFRVGVVVDDRRPITTKNHHGGWIGLPQLRMTMEAGEVNEERGQLVAQSGNRSSVCQLP
eukprot:2418547-Pyramimonas_sp.AAC.1